MKRKLIALTVLLFTFFLLSGCVASDDSGKTSEDYDPVNYIIDFDSAESFEDALNSGEDVQGKVVQFCVKDYKPNSALGINCWAGEHLNFISDSKLDVNSGDTIIGFVSKKPSKTLGSWKIPYTIIDIIPLGESGIENVEENTTGTLPSSNEVTHPAPTEVVPVQPEFTEAPPTQPEPTNPAPTQPKPTDPAPTQPTNPAPTQPKPTDPTPTQPKPTDPAPTQPKPAISGSQSGSHVSVPNHEETEGNLVWVPTNGGKKYHSRANCSNMLDPMQVSLETAIANGYTACARCH